MTLFWHVACLNMQQDWTSVFHPLHLSMRSAYFIEFSVRLLEMEIHCFKVVHTPWCYKLFYFCPIKDTENERYYWHTCMWHAL